MSYMYTSLRVR